MRSPPRSCRPTCVMRGPKRSGRPPHDAAAPSTGDSPSDGKGSLDRPQASGPQRQQPVVRLVRRPSRLEVPPTFGPTLPDVQPKARAGRQTLAPLTRRRRDARARAVRSRWTDPSRMKARRFAEVLAPDQEHASGASEKTLGEVLRRLRVGNRPAWVRGAPSAAQCDVARDRHLLRDQGRPTSGDNVPWRQPAVKKIAWKRGVRGRLATACPAAWSGWPAQVASPAAGRRTGRRSPEAEAAFPGLPASATAR